MNQHKVLKVKLFQEVAVYRNPITMEIIETYPLPAPSTILGFIQNMIGNEIEIRAGYIPIDLSIQGTYDAIMRDYQWYIKGIKKEKYPIVLNILNNVDLTIHIKAEDILLNKIKDSLKDPPYYPYLGRAEDLVFIKDVKYVDVKEEEIDYYEIQKPTYIKRELARNLKLNGILYKLSTYGCIKQFEIPKGKKRKDIINIREFIWQDYIYVEKDRIEIDTKILKDEEGDLIWWCMPNHIQKKI